MQLREQAIREEVHTRTFWGNLKGLFNPEPVNSAGLLKLIADDLERASSRLLSINGVLIGLEHQRNLPQGDIKLLNDAACRVHHLVETALDRVHEFRMDNGL